MIIEGDRARKVTSLDAVVRTLRNRALKGDLRALPAFITLMREAGLMDEDPVVTAHEELSAEDRNIITDLIQRAGMSPTFDVPKPPALPSTKVIHNTKSRSNVRRRRT